MHCFKNIDVSDMKMKYLANLGYENLVQSVYFPISRKTALEYTTNVSNKLYYLDHVVIISKYWTNAIFS